MDYMEALREILSILHKCETYTCKMPKDPREAVTALAEIAHKTKVAMEGWEYLIDRAVKKEKKTSEEDLVKRLENKLQEMYRRGKQK